MPCPECLHCQRAESEPKRGGQGEWKEIGELRAQIVNLVTCPECQICDEGKRRALKTEWLQPFLEDAEPTAPAEPRQCGKLASNHEPKHFLCGPCGHWHVAAVRCGQPVSTPNGIEYCWCAADSTHAAP